MRIKNQKIYEAMEKMESAALYCVNDNDGVWPEMPGA